MSFVSPRRSTSRGVDVDSMNLANDSTSERHTLIARKDTSIKSPSTGPIRLRQGNSFASQLLSASGQSRSISRRRVCCIGFVAFVILVSLLLNIEHWFNHSHSHEIDRLVSFDRPSLSDAAKAAQAAKDILLHPASDDAAIATQRAESTLLPAQGEQITDDQMYQRIQTMYANVQPSLETDLDEWNDSLLRSSLNLPFTQRHPALLTDERLVEDLEPMSQTMDAFPAPVTHALTHHSTDTAGSITYMKPSALHTPSGVYFVCSLTNVCIDAQTVHMHFADARTNDYWRAQLQMCNADYTDKRQPGTHRPTKHEANAAELCRCFHHTWWPSVQPVGTGFSATPLRTDSPDLTMRLSKAPRSHYWSMHQWVDIHHIAHFTQKLAMMSSLFSRHEYDTSLHAAFVDPIEPDSPVQGIDGLVFQHAQQPLQEHEKTVLDLAVQAAFTTPPSEQMIAHIHQPTRSLRRKRGSLIQSAQSWISGIIGSETDQDDEFEATSVQIKDSSATAGSTLLKHSITDHLNSTGGDVSARLLFRSDLDSVTQAKRHTCFKRLSWTPHYGHYGHALSDTAALRQAALKRANVTSTHRCPPAKALIVIRAENRRIINLPAVVALLDKYGIAYDQATITAATPSAEQAALFRNHGLILSVHSSQLANVVFAPLNSVVIEMSPEFFNPDFAQYATEMGLNYFYALGGEIEKPEKNTEPSIESCNAALLQCRTGHFSCVYEFMHKNCPNINKHFLNKDKDFSVNVTSLENALMGAFSHLNWLCYGHWARRFDKI